MQSELLSHATSVDFDTKALYLEVPRPEIVLLQALFELYDGLGTVRSTDGKTGHVVVLTSGSTLTDCILMLESIRDWVRWRPSSILEDPLA